MTEWISVKERLPEAETKVLVCSETRCHDGNVYRHITVAMYEDGTIWREYSLWNWDIEALGDYDEGKDDYPVPEGWWEYMTYEHGEYSCMRIDDFVTHWMSLPEPPEEVPSPAGAMLPEPEMAYRPSRLTWLWVPEPLITV